MTTEEHAVEESRRHAKENRAEMAIRYLQGANAPLFALETDVRNAALQVLHDYFNEPIE